MWRWLLWKSLKVNWEKVHPGVTGELNIIQPVSPFTALNASFIPHKIGFSSSLTAASRYQAHRICTGRRGIFTAVQRPLHFQKNPLLEGKWNVEELLYYLNTEKPYSPTKVINIVLKWLYEQVNGLVLCNRRLQLQIALTWTDQDCSVLWSSGA